MTFFCYVYSRGSDVPHMEALASLTLSEARIGCGRLMRDHAAATRAELFADDRQVAIIVAGDGLIPLGQDLAGL